MKKRVFKVDSEADMFILYRLIRGFDIKGVEHECKEENDCVVLEWEDSSD